MKKGISNMRSSVQTETRPSNGSRPQVQPQQPTQFASPEVNIFETKDGYVLEAEMPGVGKDGLEVTVEGNELTIVGRRNQETVTGEPLFCERQRYDFRRVFELDPAIDTGKVGAKMDQGILTLTLPKSERVKPRKINIE
jgi:HSP20 family protein